MNGHKIELPSEQFMLAMEVTAHVTFLVLIASYCILLWVCLTKSPAAMSGYKWWLIINGTAAVLFEVICTLTMPVFLLPYPMIYLDGYATKNFIFNDLASELYTDIFFFIIAFVAYVIMMIFLFRYAQTTGNIAYKLVFSSGKMNAFISVVALGIMAMLIFLPIHLYFAPREELLSILNESIPTVYDRIRNKNVVGASTRWSSFAVTYFAILYLSITLLVSAAVAFSLFDSYRFLKHNESNFSRKTKTLYLSLLHSLTIDVIMGIIMVVCPVCAVVLAVFTSPYTPLVGIVAFRIQGKQCSSGRKPRGSADKAKAEQSLGSRTMAAIMILIKTAPQKES
ncbi:serpentine type 7TM GPCR chemoreceptor srh domain-containing protein [Ditylenchus destructor]|uniref:Serpentine type 7TM GPCR chemoreceptor srh domain-containing protein n=1 Tax=Ditylenchus destructor TaxID=166010 RepID=A0AAD4QXK7_9BILA|nr:serpentine type 7TM GPCR chemoreceptor srh domain-containing protein [Ditylenchus destructor]